MYKSLKINNYGMLIAYSHCRVFKLFISLREPSTKYRNNVVSNKILKFMFSPMIQQASEVGSPQPFLLQPQRDTKKYFRSLYKMSDSSQRRAEMPKTQEKTIYMAGHFPLEVTLLSSMKPANPPTVFIPYFLLQLLYFLPLN